MLIKFNVSVTCGNDAVVITLLLHPNVNPVRSRSPIGGALGLFVGMSMLSVAEFVYWMAKSITRGIFTGQKNGNSGDAKKKKEKEKSPNKTRGVFGRILQENA